MTHNGLKNPLCQPENVNKAKHGPRAVFCVDQWILPTTSAAVATTIAATVAVETATAATES